MGEVYRAKDSKLGREVAIKVPPEAVAKDPERLGRFEREARLLASLNHPNIATIHGLERGESEFLVPPRPATKPSTSSWPRPSMITTSASAWSPPSRHSLTTWFGIRICTASFPEASFVPTDSGFPFPTSTPTPRKFCFGRRSFDFYKNTTFSRTNASKFSVHGAGADLASTMMSSSTPPIPKLSKPSAAMSFGAPSPFEDSITTKRATTSSISPNRKTEKPSSPLSMTRSTSSPACSSTFLSPTNIRSCTTATTPGEQENTPEKKRPTEDDDELNATQRKTLRRRWANLIRRVFKTDPLICKNCGGRMRVVSFITEPSVIRQILDHLQNRNSRDPPIPSHSLPQA